MPSIGTGLVQDSRALGNLSWRKVREQRSRCSLKLDRVAGMAGEGERERYVREDCLSVLPLMHMHVRGRDGGWKKEGMLHLAGVCYSQIGLEHVTCASKLNLALAWN